MAINSDPQPEDELEEDWFGEGTAFTSEEDLASALFSLAGAVVTPPGVAAVLEESPFHLDASTMPRPGNGAASHAAAEGVTDIDDGPVFETIDAFEPQPETVGRVPVRITPVAPPSSRTWGIRAPGVDPLPPRQPGRTGWSIRNSVQVLRRTEEVMQRLREEAVVAAFSAAARALHDLPDNYSASADIAAAARSDSRRRINV